MAAKTGAARIALTAGVPVIPMAHWGAQEVMGPYRKEFKAFPRKTMHVLIGPPVELDDLRAEGEPDAEALRQATSIGIMDLEHGRFTQVNGGDLEHYLEGLSLEATLPAREKH